MMHSVNRETAHRDPCAHSFRHGMGYFNVGRPPLPTKPAGHSSLAEPPVGTAADSWHVLVPPQGGKGIALKWIPHLKCWLPVAGTGIRVGFSSEYLAAHGWKYQGPRVAGN